ncbi:hypothetical protein AB1Y20_006846 [Prymnesium parvum]|uniref:EngB-type G domain-containing protein n=1 Tax=Prymnesium parvum TaxID=97485 RepID=A0AB34IZ63_PRYPA|mmetsp:Transcript_4492/g.11179  ORF Transcript_4492/g.11179 Transcript_4492/m.11179 type:complete len:242 (-) Transcript_4492:79-804(-)
MLCGARMLAVYAAGLIGAGLPHGPRRTAARRLAPLATASWQGVADKQGVEYLGSFVSPKQMPNLQLPEVCLAGRSNVGKSSALNTLAGRRKKVAVVSKSPGRTRTLNLFKVGSACCITDLPGYGFAKVSMDMQEQWRKSIETYLTKREQLRLAVLFVDLQREPQEQDAQLLDFLSYYGLETVVVGTKFDKLKANERDSCVERIRQSLKLPEKQPIVFSSVTGVGRTEVWRHIQEVCSTKRK